MNQHQEPEQPKASPAGFDADAVCEGCGRYGGFCFGGRTLCETCYGGCGSCCPEFGKDDLWDLPEDL